MPVSYKRKSLFRDLQQVMLHHASANDGGLKRTVRDTLMTVRQICEVRKISFGDMSMQAHDKWAERNSTRI